MKSMALFRIVRMVVLCGFSFFRYMRSAGLAERQGIIILSSHEGANWGRSDVQRAGTLISLRRLNLIKHLDMFISSLVRLLPPDSSFVGCFAQKHIPETGKEHTGAVTGFSQETGYHSRCGYRELNSARVSAILERSGMVVLDMRELNGLTYFHSRKNSGNNLNQ